MREEIRTILAQYADEKYRDFSAGLIPGAKPLLGVRLPQLRRIAKSIVNDKENKIKWRDEIASYDGAYADIYFEETMLRGMLFGCACKEIGELLAYLEDFIPRVGNWSVCDSVCRISGTLSEIRAGISGPGGIDYAFGSFCKAFRGREEMFPEEADNDGRP